MRFAVAIVCSLLLVWGQFAVASAMCDSTAKLAGNCCHCGGKMNCCSAKPASSQPVPANNARAGFQNQIVSPIPAAMVWVLAAAGTTSISPTVSPSLNAGAVPIFERNCARLI